MGKPVYCRYFAVYVLLNDKKCPRLGLSVSKKVGNAVTRNKLRRRIKEYFRLYGQNMPNVDIVIAARYFAQELVFIKTFNDVKKIMDDLLNAALSELGLV